MKIINTSSDINSNENSSLQNATISFDPLFIRMLENINISNTDQQRLSCFPESSTINFNKSDDKLPAKNKRAYNGTVDPITDIDDIIAAQEYFLNQPQRFKSNKLNIRNYALFTLACNCARRIGDILSLKIYDVLTEDFSMKDRIKIKEQKTNKAANVYLNDIAKSALQLYIDSLDKIQMNDPLFKSRNHRDVQKSLDKYNEALITNNENNIKQAKERLEIAIRFGDAIEPRSAWRIYKDMSKAIGLYKKGINVGTHSARKTWAYNAIHSDPTNPDMIVEVSEALNHSDIKVTRRYAGITQERMDNLMNNTQIGKKFDIDNL